MSIEGKLKAGAMIIDGMDSQPVSALLFALSFLKDSSEIYVINPGEKPWVDLTLHFLDFVGANIFNHSYRLYEVAGGLSYDGFNIKIGGDYSTALFPIAAAILSKKKLEIYGLDPKSMQGDKVCLDIFRKMGAKITFNSSNVLQVHPVEQLNGINVDINNCIDILPILCTLATFAKTKTVITGGEIAKYKESDRIAAMEGQLQKMGGDLKATNDGMIIFPSKLKGALVDGEKDHRVILSLMVAAMSIEGVSQINGIESLSKSYPTAIYDFIHCGSNIELIV
jgi:3-phosphoshikimate 1-carboxyvinyltransferase